jgi:hypothetical protein
LQGACGKHLNFCAADRSVDQKYFQDAPGRISLTFDAWTSKIMTSYLAITGHWIDTEYKLRSELLAFSEIDGSHSGENIAHELLKVLKRYNIQEKVSVHSGSSRSIKCENKPDFFFTFRLKI